MLGLEPSDRLQAERADRHAGHVRAGQCAGTDRRTNLKLAKRQLNMSTVCKGKERLQTGA